MAGWNTSTPTQPPSGTSKRFAFGNEKLHNTPTLFAAKSPEGVTTQIIGFVVGCVNHRAQTHRANVMLGEFRFERWSASKSPKAHSANQERLFIIQHDKKVVNNDNSSCNCNRNITTNAAGMGKPRRRYRR